MNRSGGQFELGLEWLPGRYAVCRLPADAAAPMWAEIGDHSPAGDETRHHSSFISITRTDRELSIVLDESRLPRDLDQSVKVERGFVALRIAGTLDFSAVGILAKLTAPLAAANVPVFVISTFETDALMVRADDQQRAIAALGRSAEID